MSQLSPNRESCIHSRNIFSLIDTGKIETLMEHIGQCKVCQKSYADIQAVLEQIDLKIPRQEISFTEREGIEKYIAKLLGRVKKGNFFTHLFWAAVNRLGGKKSLDE